MAAPPLGCAGETAARRRCSHGRRGESSGARGGRLARFGGGARPVLALTVQLLGARLERADHARDRLVEQQADQLLQHARLELEIDVEVDDAAAVVRLDET